MIERVAELLSDPRLHLDADDIADALWLALQIEAIAPDQGAPEQPAPADDDDDTDPEPPPKPPGTQTDTKTTSQQEKESGNLYPSPGQQQGDAPDDMRGVPFRTPAASALPAAREIAKALRPLMRRYPSRTQAVFDEQATVQKIADERIAWIGGRRSRVSGLWHIQLQPARERWFDVELVADVGASMVLWRQSIAEFHHLLLRHGAFRRVRAWSLNTDNEKGQPGLYPGLGDTATRQPPRSRQELLAPGGRRLILMVTDCVSPGWHAGVVTDLLSFWGAHHPIALVQVLPERLWSGSALRAASAIQMQSSGPDVANRRLAYTFQSPMDRLLLRRRATTHPTTRLPVPVLTLDGDQVAAWASLVTGTGMIPTSGFLLTSTPDASMPILDEDEQPADDLPPEQLPDEDAQPADDLPPEQLPDEDAQPVDDLSPEQLVDDFHEYASPEAFRLAQFLAAAPLSLPVIRLVQRTMMPKARQGHIAEVFLSGLLRRHPSAKANVHPEYVWYDFLAGVREVLREGLTLFEYALVMDRVTEYVREHYGTPQDFQALLFDPDAKEGLSLDPRLRPFAEVVTELQERVGVRDAEDKTQEILELEPEPKLQTEQEYVDIYSTSYTTVNEVEPIILTLRFGSTSQGDKTQVLWEADSIGSRYSSFVMPYQGEDLSLVIKTLDALQYPGHPQMGPQFTSAEQEKLTKQELWSDNRIVPDLAKHIGQRLYTALFADIEAKRILQVIQNQARALGQPISYILSFPTNAVHLAALPWEILWPLDQDSQGPLLFSGGSLGSIERHIESDSNSHPSLTHRKKPHILALSPHTGIPDTVRTEERSIRLRSWQSLKDRGLIDWDELSPVTMRALDDRMRREPIPDIIHFYGHGIYRDHKGFLLFDGMITEGKSELVNVDRLRLLWKDMRLITLLSAQSAAVSGEQPSNTILNGIAPALSLVSEAVVGMQLTVRISAANRFSDVLYTELALGRSLQVAVAHARRSLYVEDSDGASWYVPTLYTRSRQRAPFFQVRPDLK